ncbi:MAG: hypothetical protein A2Y67_02315 [Candidatus Buchananbacteria bacterium RBG_13_39_9]|uniref:Uncharacterized protein n=1 Tax=Candidatus Buchananbacteria bacterium RBG_13_39_9 TaxID=1797531 RepID=A0A1G1XRT5_9BACT|nr:MAG: hypothetical protein A2Y67_02315 [Candidatus Buchananbacteria bacterium RBG_13_39_9]
MGLTQKINSREKKMEKNEQMQKTPGQEVCQCGSPTETKHIQAGWGTTLIQVCTNPDCQCKKKNQEKAQSQKVGWGK